MKDLFQILNEDTIEARVLLMSLYRTFTDESFYGKSTVAHIMIDQLTGLNNEELKHYNGVKFLENYIYNNGSKFAHDQDNLPSLSTVEKMKFDYVKDTSILFNNLNNLITSYIPVGDEENVKSTYIENLLKEIKEMNKDNDYLDLTELAGLRHVQMSKCWQHLPIFINECLKKKEYIEDYNLFGELGMKLQMTIFTVVKKLNSIYNGTKIIDQITTREEYKNDPDMLRKFSSVLVRAQNEFLGDFSSKTAKVTKKDTWITIDPKKAKKDIKTFIINDENAILSFKNYPKVQSYLNTNLSDEQKAMVDVNPVSHSFDNVYDELYVNKVPVNITNIIEVLELQPERFKTMINVLKMHNEMDRIINLDFAESILTNLGMEIYLLIRNKSEKEVEEWFKEHNGKGAFESFEESLVVTSATVDLQEFILQYMLVAETVDFNARIICASVVGAASGCNKLPRVLR